MNQRELVERAQRGDHDAFAVLAGASIARLDAASRFEPTISPDGSLLAYATWEATSPEGRIRVVDIDKDGDHEVTKPDRYTWQAPAFSPDGTKLLLYRFDMGTEQARIATLDVRDGSSIAIGQPSGNPQPGMGWSPDGTQVIAEYDTNPKQTWLFNADGTNSHLAPFSSIEHNGSTWERRAP